VALSLAAARMALDLHAGRVNPRELGYELDVPQAGDQEVLLRELASSEDVRTAFDAMEPQLRHYWLLRSTLLRYRQLALQRDLTQLAPLSQPFVAPYDHYEGAPALRRLLGALGDLRTDETPPPGAEQIFDAELSQALQHFQWRHGLERDGILGPRTWLALTTPLVYRAEQIALTLERIRWLPPRLGSPPIIVNIPQFRLFAFRSTEDAAADILQMDVVVGTAFSEFQTPVFAADMRYVVLNPYWDVPRSILLRELLPALRADPGWAAANDYEIVRGDGDDALPQSVTPQNLTLLERGVFRLRQRPGPLNALGRVKFMFPNSHGVYLHDTPARGLFVRTQRAFSHGCIRVASPMELLKHVLRNDPTWTDERLSEVLKHGAPLRIDLPEPIHVYILYGTAFATEAGDTFFFTDIYGHDARLEALLARPRA
jgi:murein L,D-transpeptidase YcbB/YkuD